MSLFTESSLCLVPSGVKDGKVYSIKPTDGSGDLTFSRGSDIEATRVASNGYIEKAKVNLLLQSNQFDTTWTNNGTTETGGQSGYNGSSDAWLIEKSIAGGSIRQSIVYNGVGTFSIYAKAGSLNYTLLYINYGSGTDTQAYFDLSSGSVGTTSAEIDATISSVGGGWYRCSVSFNTPSAVATILVFPADADNDTSGTSGNIYIQDAQLNYGLVAQDYVETTTTSVVSGITNDMPRLDYSGGASCPSLKLEPSRTNLVTQSEYFGTWLDTDISLTSNYGTSPEGVQNSTRLVLDNLTSSRIALAPSLTDGTTYTFSCWYKGTAGEKLYMEGNGSGGSGTLTNKLVTLTGDWQREDLQFVGGSTSNLVYIVDSRNGTEDSATDFEVYGAQCEAGSYPTSYIPTYGTSATRTADACSKTGISSLIGQTEGTLFADIDLNLVGSNVGFYALQVYDSAASPTYGKAAYIEIYQGRVYGYVRNTTIQGEIVSTAYADNTRLKIAFGYKANDFVLYVNGVQIGTDTSGNLPSVLNSLALHYSAASQQGSPLHQALLFKTRLSNADLATLTA